MPVTRQRAGQRPALLRPPDAFLFLLALLLEPGLLAGDLFADLIGLIEVPGREHLAQLLLEEDLPLGELALVDAVDLGQPGFFSAFMGAAAGSALARRSIASS